MIGESGPFCFNADVPFSYDLVKPWFYLALGFGAESFLYFRWRESVNGEETHPAILPWTGRKSFVYDQIKAQMDEYASLPVSLARLPLEKGEVAIVHNAESHIYALTDAYACQWKGLPDYQFEVERNLHMALIRRGVKVDLVQMSEDVDLSPYKGVFLAQSFTVPESVIGRLRDYVKTGGAVVAVNRFNFLESHGFSIRSDVGPCGATDLFGIEIDDRRTLSYGDVEYAKPTTAAVVSNLADTCFRGRPYVTRNHFGKGTAWYVTKVPTRDMCRAIVGEIMPCIGVSLKDELPDNVFRLVRGDYVIVINFTEKLQTIAAERGERLMGDCDVKCQEMAIKPFSVSIWRN